MEDDDDETFAERMRFALKEKEHAESELADAVASSALASDDESSEVLLAAREAHSLAEANIGKLVEEASVYAERAASMTEALRRVNEELEGERRARREAESEIVRLKALNEEATHARAVARSELVASRKSSEKSASGLTAARAKEVEAERRAVEAVDREKASLASAAAVFAIATDERAKATKDVEDAVKRAIEAEEGLRKARRANEKQLTEARADAEVHRQRRLATRSELVSVSKALEDKRSELNKIEKVAKDTMVPHLLSHARKLADLVERAVAVGRDAGAEEDTLLSSTRRRHDITMNPAHHAKGDDDTDSLSKKRYVTEVQEEIARLDLGLTLLSQTFDVIELAVHKRKSLCRHIFMDLAALVSSSSKRHHHVDVDAAAAGGRIPRGVGGATSASGRPSRLNPSRLNPARLNPARTRGPKKKNRNDAYHRVDNAPLAAGHDLDDDEEAL